MSVKLKLVSSFSTPHFPSKQTITLSSRVGLFDTQCCKKNNLFTNNNKVTKSCQLHQRLRGKEILSKRQHILFTASGDSQSTSDLETDEFELEMQQPYAEDTTPSYLQFQGSGGKPGLLSFYGHAIKRRDDKNFVSSSAKNLNNPLWFIGPSVLVASFVFPSLYLRKILSKILEDSLLTDFLILFFTEVLFYCGVAVFLLMIDHLQRHSKSISSAERDLAPHLGHRISNVAVLVLSLIIPMVTMGFVWPWTGPAASATLAPYLVGIVVQFTFEQYARHVSSPSWSAIPIIFQVYRLHQLNRAAQLVTALSFTVRGAEMTSHNLAINGSLSTLLNVLQFLGIICIWSLSSFIMRYFPSTTTLDQ